jgi:hypothetical protein
MRILCQISEIYSHAQSEREESKSESDRVEQINEEAGGGGGSKKRKLRVSEDETGAKQQKKRNESSLKNRRCVREKL